MPLPANLMTLFRSFSLPGKPVAFQQWHSIFTLFAMILFTGLFSTAGFAANEKKYSYEDRELWQALPQSEIEIGDNVYSLTTLKPDKQKQRLYLWINENAVPNNGDSIAIQGLKDSGDVWYLDTADALFIERSRMTLRGLSGEFMRDLMNRATETYKEVVVVSFDAASVPVLRGLRLWQQTADETLRDRLKNVVLLYPSLFVNAPVAGQIPELFPIAFNTALPITILQPAQGAQANTVGITERALKMGGSLVNTIQVPIATDGYFKFQDIRQMAEDASQRIKKATQSKIDLVNKIKYRVAKLDPVNYEVPQSQIIAGLIKLASPQPMQTFTLNSFEGKKITVPEDYKGKALLVNF